MPHNQIPVCPVCGSQGSLDRRKPKRATGFGADPQVFAFGYTCASCGRKMSATWDDYVLPAAERTYLVRSGFRI